MKMIKGSRSPRWFSMYSMIVFSSTAPTVAQSNLPEPIPGLRLVAAQHLGGQGVTGKSVPKFQFRRGARQRGDGVGLPRCVGPQTFVQFRRCDRLNSESRRYFHVEAGQQYLSLFKIPFQNCRRVVVELSLIHISEPTRRPPISY